MNCFILYISYEYMKRKKAHEKAINNQKNGINNKGRKRISVSLPKLAEIEYLFRNREHSPT